MSVPSPLSIAPRPAREPREAHTYRVVVTFPDGSSETVDGVVKVRPGAGLIALLGPAVSKGAVVFNPTLVTYVQANVRKFVEVGR